MAKSLVIAGVLSLVCGPVAGCTFALDADLVRVDASEPDADGPEPDASEPDADEPEPDADEPEPDASEPDAGDVEPPPCDGLPCPVSCSTDDECASDEYCSLRIGGGCVPRCTEGLGCAGPLLDDYANLESDGERVYIASSEEKDALGNVLRAGRIRAWRPGGELVDIATDLRYPGLLFIAGDYLYYSEMDIGSYWAVERVALSGAEQPERIVARTRAAWATSTHVFWSVAVGSTAELWRMPIAGGAAAQRILNATHDGWFSGNDSIALRSEQRDPERQNSSYVVADSLSNAAQHTDLSGPDYSVRINEPALVLGDVFYVRISTGDTAIRLDANLPGEFTFLPGAYTPVGKLRAQADYVYWAGVDFLSSGPDYPCVYLRTVDRVGGATSQIHSVSKRVNEGNTCPFVVIESTLFFEHDAHLFSKEFEP